MAKSHIPTADEVRQLIDYDPDTGILTWRPMTRAECGSEMAWRARHSVFGKAAGSIMPNGYRSLLFRGRRYYAHRMAWLLMEGEWPCVDVDHINGVRDDNRWINLRAATRSQNHQNRIGNPATGASWHERMGRWRAVITLGRRQKHVGYFDTQEEAAAAYRRAKAEHHAFQPKVRTKVG